MTDRETFDRLAARFPAFELEFVEGADPAVLVRGQNLLELAQYMRDEEEYDFCSSVTAVDYPDRFELVYHLYSMKNEGGPAILKVHCNKEDPRAPSVVSIWTGADWHEREVWDLMGVRFDGHPDLRRILLWEGYEGHPLRKDFPGSEDEYIFS